MKFDFTPAPSARPKRTVRLSPRTREDLDRAEELLLEATHELRQAWYLLGKARMALEETDAHS